MKDRTFKYIVGSDNPLETARKLLAPYNMQKVNDKIKSCKLCNNNNIKKLCTGNADADILIILDYASDQKDYEEFFENLLKYSNINKKNIFVTYAVNCVCKRSDGAYRMPSYTELKNCKQYTDFVIDAVKPKVIISMGATSLNQFVPDNVNILDNIDKNTYYKGIHTIITYSVRDIFNFNKLNEPTEEKIDEIIKSLNNAQEYVNNIKE